MSGENYHRIGSLLPNPGEKSKFSQLYIYDTENEVANKISIVRMDKNSNPLHTKIVFDIKEMLDSHNPYVQTYRMVQYRLKESNACNLKVKIMGKRGKKGRRYNLPTTSKVAALVMGNFDVGNGERDIILETQQGYLQRIFVVSYAYLPLHYPLLFPHGEDRYSDDIPLKEATIDASKKREKVSMREFFAHRIQQRGDKQVVLLYSKRLFQQFFVDAYSIIESVRLNYVKTHQKQLGQKYIKV
uniref:Helitron helicase-like domain-containing protein n=1 Tax=Cajanus cajan TaxID=3821 RepID=A0A151UIG2_CAJCA